MIKKRAMAKSKFRIQEADELSDEGALEHSRGKYARYQDTAKEENNSSDEEKMLYETRKSYESKHTLDSDEEEEVKYKKLDMDKIEGQEETGQEYEGNTKIMAFNMQEDLEEGHFDAAGNFIFNKKENEIEDAWLDNIDWANVKANAGEQWHQKNEEDNTTTKIFEGNELKSVYERIALMLKPNETIERALARFGKEKGLSAAEERKKRWAAKKAGKEYSDEGTVALKELTELADALVSNGELEAYQYTLEKLRHMVQDIECKAVDVLDMFSDSVPNSTAGENSAEDSNGAAKVVSDAVMWEYKLSDDDNAEIVGPVSSEEMLKLQEEGKFENGGWARKKSTKTFYSVARLDFEIYI